MAVNRINILWGVLIGVGGLALGAWFVGQKIQSPAEVAARAAPPSPSPILVPIEQRVLSSDVVTRGTVRFGLPQSVSLAPSVLKGSAGLIATLPPPNTQFEEGEVVLTASGRPVFMLQGRRPTYRDISPGTSGEDVRQLEEALARLGFDPGSVDGVYDEKTADAVGRWYRAKGWEPFGPTREQIAAVRALERDRADAMRNRLAAETALATAQQAAAAARAVGEQAIRQATLENVVRSDDRRRLSDAQTGDPLTVDAERARAEHAQRAAEADVAAQIAERALIVLDPRQTETQREVANAKLEVARAARRKARAEGDLAVQTAERDASLAPERARVAEAALRSARLEGDKNVRAALDQQKLAEFDLKVASERAAQLAGELDLARRKLGLQVPADEVVFMPSLPARLHEVAGAIGGSATGKVLSVTDNQLSIDSQLPIEAAPLVRPGMKVAIDEQALGVRASGTVETVASTPGTLGVDGYHFYLGIRVDSTPIKLEGFSVRLTIPIGTTKGAVIAVPVSALSLAADGTSRVQVERGDNREYVTVQPGLSVGGYVEVTADDGRLTPGQLVVVGYKMVEPGS